MSEPKFTPGPWEAIPGNSMIRVNPLVDPRYLGGLYIADIQLLLQEAEANANLIAAAPEMYGLLDELDKAATAAEIDALYARIPVLLKKARGEK